MTADGSDRGRLVPPNLDDRRWADLVADAMELKEKYAPQWTSREPSDPGVTLIELFAYLTEQLIYRLNQVPEKNYVAFLSMLGISRIPAAPARTVLAFRSRPGAPATVPAGSLAQTTGTESRLPVVFRTEHELQVVPGTVQIAYADRPPNADPVTDITTSLLATSPQGPPGEAFRLQPSGTKPAEITVLLGFAEDFAPQPGGSLDVHVEIEFGIEDKDDPSPADLAESIWTYSTNRDSDAATDPRKWPALTVQRGPVTAGGSELGAVQTGTVRLRVPANPEWDAQKPSDWTRRPSGVTDQHPARRWIAITLRAAPPRRQDIVVRHLLLNSVDATTALDASRGGPETVGDATGDVQVLALQHRPIFLDTAAASPLHHLEVRVGDEPWAIGTIGDSRDARVFRLDTSSAELTFGLPVGVQLPPRGDTITARYRYVAAGASGNVAAGAVVSLAEPILDIVGVSNPVPGTLGQDEEPIEDTKARAPQLLRSRDRAVTAEDYEFLTRQVSTHIAQARCLPARLGKDNRPWTYAGMLRAPGNVHVLVVPDSPLSEPRPMPPLSLVHQVIATLDRCRDVTADLHVGGPKYLAIKVDVTLVVFPSATASGQINSAEEEAQRIGNMVESFLHPVKGGPSGRGWEIGQNLYASDLYKHIKPSDEVGYISDLKLTALKPPPYHPSGPWTDSHRPFALAENSPSVVRVTDYELISFGSHNVRPTTADQ